MHCAGQGFDAIICVDMEYIRGNLDSVRYTERDQVPAFHSESFKEDSCRALFGLLWLAGRPGKSWSLLNWWCGIEKWIL